MKKTLFLAAMLAFAVQSQAQSTTQPLVAQSDNTNSKALGVNLLFGSFSKNFGVGVKYQQFVDNHVRLEGSFGYYFPSKGENAWDLNLNAHYVFRLNPKWAVYPLAGFAITNWGYEYNEPKDGKIYVKTGHNLAYGANFGAGVQYFLTNSIFVNAEGRQQVLSGNYSQANFSLGLVAKF